MRSFTTLLRCESFIGKVEGIEIRAGIEIRPGQVPTIEIWAGTETRLGKR